MRTGILSDTHGLLRDEVVKALDGVDHIIHAGDIDRKEVIDSLESIAPVTVVRGNADKDWAEHIPMTASIDLSGKRFYVIHNKAKIDSDLSLDHNVTVSVTVKPLEQFNRFAEISPFYKNVINMSIYI